MKTNTPINKPTQADHDWADEAIKDLMLGCALNFRLKNSGICSKYLFEMTNEELISYTEMIEELHREMKG